MKELTPEEFQQLACELSNELDNLISYDEWAAREYRDTRVDYYDTACNLIKAGYRKVKEKCYIAYTQYQDETEILGVFANIADAESCCFDDYMDVQYYNFMRKLHLTHPCTVDDALDSSKKWNPYMHYVEECIYE